MAFRTEHDLIGEFQIPEEALYGVHTARSVENFTLTGRHVHPAWIHAMGEVKLACAKTSRHLGAWADDPAKADAIEMASLELAEGKLDEWMVHGDYSRISPLDDVNYQQSTNDVCPTALKIALIREIDNFMPALKTLEFSLRQQSEKLADVVKVGRTQYQDAVLTTLGFEFKAYAEALNRDFERLVRMRKMLGHVNLGGTAIGTCVSASHAYVEQVVPMLARVTGLELVQNDDLIDGTQNLDVFAMLSGEIKTLSVTLLKMSTDLRFMSSGPQTGISEIHLPPRQAGSSIMPGKVNPVIPEAMTQVNFRVIGHDTAVTFATSQGNLELNPFLPLIADCLLNDFDLLGNACMMMSKYCIQGIEADTDKCRQGVASSTALITAMVARIGYDRACQIGIDAVNEGKPIKQKLLELNLLTEEECEALTSASAVRSTMADRARHG